MNLISKQDFFDKHILRLLVTRSYLYMLGIASGRPSITETKEFDKPEFLDKN